MKKLSQPTKSEIMITGLTRANFLWKIFPVFVLLLFMNTMTAQSIMSFESRIESLSPGAAQHLQSLVYDLNPNIYLTSDALTSHGQGAPLVAICDARSIHRLYDNHPDYKHVELIRITLNSPGDRIPPIDMNKLQVFENLQYLYFIYTYNVCGNNSEDCIRGILGNLVQGSNSPVVVIYMQSILQ